jgi:hypothetical protein
MKAQLMFNMSDEDDRYEYLMAMNGKNAFLAFGEIDNFMRSIVKYGEASSCPELQALLKAEPDLVTDVVSILRDRFFEIRNIYNALDPME